MLHLLPLWQNNGASSISVIIKEGSISGHDIFPFLLFLSSLPMDMLIHNRGSSTMPRLSCRICFITGIIKCENTVYIFIADSG